MTEEHAKDAAAMERYQRLRRAAVALILIAVVLVTAFGRSSLPDLHHERMEKLGIMLILTGIAGRLWSILYIGGRKSEAVVQYGPYSITRNPLYLFSAVAAGGVGAQLGSVVAAVGFALLCVVIFHVVILREERFLGARFGRPYDDYRSRVPRFFPDVRLYRDQEFVTFKPRVLVKTLLDGMWFFLSLPLFEVIENAQDAGWLPILFHLW